ncbi:hypothetical protein DID80_05585 [Candidatus Marinamargulisbacteria bacterium SCGC AAA071-K20]|nr:hypothetical protein DID80_05585 [Candidatus Marinamargulisbacteria bacterium SCGC AAA071-K20]
MKTRWRRLLIAFFFIFLLHSLFLLVKKESSDYTTFSEESLSIQKTSEFRIELIKRKKNKKNKSKPQLKENMVLEEDVKKDEDILSDDAINQKKSSQYEKSLTSYQVQVLRAIEKNKYYPSREKRRGHEGRVTVGFVINSNGIMSKLIILHQSSYENLDEAALESVRNAAPFKKFPKQIIENELVFNIHIDFIL